MTPDAKKIAAEYVQKQLANLGGKIPAQRQIKAAVRKVAAVIEEIRTAAARLPKAKSK